jgi:HlyD family secretion protein
MWRLLTSRRALQAAAIMGVLLIVALWPEATAVEVGSVTRGALAVTIHGQGETRVHHRYIVSAPMAATVERIPLEPGHGVERGITVVARLRPEAPVPLDHRARAEAAAAVEAARRAEASARADEERARAALEQAAADLKREQEAFDAGQATQQSLEARRNLVVSGEESVNVAQYGTAAALAELERAQARLASGRAVAAGDEVIEILAPVDGVVLKRFHEGEGVVAAGERLLEIGDPSHVRIVASLPAEEAVKVEPGMRVDVEHWGGDTPLAAWVERVDPSGSVIIDFEDDRAAWRAMGDGFQVQVRIRIWEAEDVLRIPTSALIRTGDQWAAYVVQNGRARRTILDVGQRTELLAEVVDGLAAGQQIVLNPPDTLTDNARVALRP